MNRTLKKSQPFLFLNLADVSDIFIFSSVSGAGKGTKSSRQKGGGLLFGNRDGGGSEEGRLGGAHRRWEGVAGWGAGLNIFFRGRNVHQVKVWAPSTCLCCFTGKKPLRFGICDFEMQRLAISFRDFSAMFSAEPAVRVAILNSRFENAALAIAIFWDAKLICWAMGNAERFRIYQSHAELGGTRCSDAIQEPLPSDILFPYRTPLNDPTPTRPNAPETDPKRTKNKLSGVGEGGGVHMGKNGTI